MLCVICVIKVLGRLLWKWESVTITSYSAKNKTVRVTVSITFINWLHLILFWFVFLILNKRFQLLTRITFEDLPVLASQRITALPVIRYSPTLCDDIRLNSLNVNTLKTLLFQCEAMWVLCAQSVTFTMWPVCAIWFSAMCYFSFASLFHLLRAGV